MKYSNTRTCVWTSAWIAAALCTTAYAQVGMDDPVYFGPEASDWELTLGGSGSSSHDFDGGRADLAAGLGYYLTPNWEVAIRQGLGFSDFGESSWSGSTRGAIDYHFILDRWRPFVGANIGGLYGDDVTETFAAGLEGGVKYYVSAKTFILGMIEWQWLFNDADDADNAFDDGQFVYTLAVGFNF
jgi:hypothetical protein